MARMSARFSMHYQYLALLITLSLLITACERVRLLPGGRTPPQPTELATTPLPEGAQPGGLEAAFVSLASISGGQGERCYTLYRFYPDGLALYAAMACSEETPSRSSWADVEAWFRREDPDIPRGDYYRQGQRIWIRIVSYDSIYEIHELRSFQGEICPGEMVLQEPTVRTYSGVPSDLTQPVQEYMRIDKLIPDQEKPGSTTEANSPGGASDEACRVARFQILYRPSVALAGGQIEYRIQSDPGESCTLRYTLPDGTPSQASGTGAIRADRRGICSWIWEAGDQVGQAIVTVRIGGIEQDFRIEIR